MKDHAVQYIQNVTKTLEAVNQDDLVAVAQAMIATYQSGGTIYIFGNGGSGSTASHICGDFIKGVSYGMDKRFKMICFNDNNSSFSAISNDIGYEDVFVEPLKNFLQKDDMVIGISGSGNSENVVRALSYAKDNGGKTVSFTGYKGGKIKSLTDLAVHVPIDDMEITEDLHLVAFHIIKQMIIKELRGDNVSMGSVYDDRVK